MLMMLFPGFFETLDVAVRTGTVDEILETMVLVVLSALSILTMR
ncbi:MAG: hypothetical protein AAGB03_06500 [Pseudomonadota bacterium]